MNTTLNTTLLYERMSDGLRAGIAIYIKVCIRASVEHLTWLPANMIHYFVYLRSVVKRSSATLVRDDFHS